jgi:WD40 repeat protein
MNCRKFSALSVLLIVLISTFASGQEDNRLIGRVTFKDVKVTALAMDTESKHIVIGYNEGSLSIFEPKPGRIINIQSFPAHNRNVSGAAFSSDNKLVASVGIDGTLKIWDTNVIAKFQTDCENRKEGAPMPPNPSPKKVINAQSGSLTGVSFAPSGKQVATSGSDGSVKIWNVDTGKLVSTIAAHKGAANTVAYSPDGTMIASGGVDKFARVWKTTATGKPLYSLGGHDGPVNAIDFSAESKQLATGSGAPKKGGQVRIYDLETGKEAYSLSPIDDTVTTVSFHPKLPRLATGGKDKKVRVWDLKTQKILYVDGHARDLVRIQFAGDGGRLGTVCPDEAKYWQGSPQLRP